MFSIGNDCAFAKLSENHGSVRYDLKNGGPVSQYMWHIKEPLLLKAGSAMHRTKFAALALVMVTVARELKKCLCG
jgi:hypothetical protein